MAVLSSADRTKTKLPPVRSVAHLIVLDRSVSKCSKTFLSSSSIQSMWASRMHTLVVEKCQNASTRKKKKKNIDDDDDNDDASVIRSKHNVA